jgi:4-hydroxybenzoate polyprenyltransferase
MRRISEALRFDEWKASKINPLLAGAALGAGLRWDGWPTAWLVLAFIVVVLFNASFGYSINNLSDAEIDQAAGKSNPFSTMVRWKSTVIVLALLAGGIGMASVAFGIQSAAFAWTLLSFGAAAAYSVRPFRLKERGAFGLAASSLAQRVIPLFIVFAALDSWSAAPVVFVVLSFFIGVRFMLIHQILDLENDQATGVATFLTAKGIDFADKVTLRVIFPLELLSLTALVACLGQISWVQGLLVTLSVAAYGAIEFLRLRSNAYREVALSYLGLNFVYALALPLFLLIPLVANGLPAVPLVVLFALFVGPEITRQIHTGRVLWRTWSHRLTQKRLQKATYPYPIGIVLFNRPEYARAFLESLVQQDILLDPSRVVIHLDAYVGSRDEARGTVDMTKQVRNLVAEFIPGATVIAPKENVGIAGAFDSVETALEAMPHSEWLTLFEEDFVLYPSYLRAMLTVIDFATANPHVAMVSATGDGRGPESVSLPLIAQLHLWAYSVRKVHVIERKMLIKQYLDVVSLSGYWQRDDEAVWRACAEMGLFPMGSSQDYIKRASLQKFGRVGLTTSQPYGYYVGERGEHFTPQAFQAQGYHNRSPEPADVPVLHGGLTEMVVQAAQEFSVMMAEEGVENVIVPMTAARQVTHTSGRWKVQDDQLFLEGPFPELGLFRPFVWLTGNSCVVILEVNATGRYRLSAVVANSLPDQVATISVGSSSVTMDIPPAGPNFPSTVSVECDLAAGHNEILISYARSEMAPGDTRHLALMLYDVYV